MKKIIILIACIAVTNIAFSQSTEIQQLLLDVEKLSQFKQILSDLKKGYEILVTGYGAIKNISEGNFSLHQNFLEGLLQVSPAVQRYARIKDIVDYELRIVKEGKAAFSHYRSDNNFTVAEIDYMSKVFGKLFDNAAAGLDDLVTVVTAGKLRMSDDDRLKMIDHIFAAVEDQYAFLRNFNHTTAILSMERQKEKQEVELSKKLFGIK